MGKSFAVIDVGSEETFALAARWIKNGGYSVEGFHRARSSGMSDGSVTEVYPASDHIRSLLAGLSKKTGISFHDVYAGISSPSVQVFPSTGSILISRYGREVSFRDIKKCVEIGSLARIPLDREVLHRIVMGFSVDGERLIRDPEGLEAVKLGVEVNIATINVTFVRNFSKSIAQAGYIPSGFVLSPLASSTRILSEDDKLDRTVFILTHGKKTEVLFLNSGNLENCVVFDEPIAKKHFSSGAEEEGNEFGMFFKVVSSMRGWQDMRRIVVSGTRTVPEEFLQYVEKASGMPVRVGLPLTKPFEDLPEDGASYAAALGVLDQLGNSKSKKRGETNPFKRAVYKMMGTLDEYF